MCIKYIIVTVISDLNSVAELDILATAKKLDKTIFLVTPVESPIRNGLVVFVYSSNVLYNPDNL